MNTRWHKVPLSLCHEGLGGVLRRLKRHAACTRRTWHIVERGQRQVPDQVQQCGSSSVPLASSEAHLKLLVCHVLSKHPIEMLQYLDCGRSTWEPRAPRRMYSVRR